jgi:glyoxylase-like metal-dependent hydrolase (beta-lactamase superfamily II)
LALAVNRFEEEARKSAGRPVSRVPCFRLAGRRSPAPPPRGPRPYLSHHHGDHIGGLPAVRWWATEAEVVTSEHEGQVISGRRPPDPPSNALFRFFAQRQQLPTVPVDRVVHEGDTFAGFRVISTPGHTNGHTSLINEQHGLLFTGDAFGSTPFKVRVGVRKFFCTDPAEAERSAEKLLREEFSTVVFTHGKPLCEDAKRRLSEIAARDQ